MKLNATPQFLALKMRFLAPFLFWLEKTTITNQSLCPALRWHT